MELGLSLGDSPRPRGLADAGRDLGLTLGLGSAKTRQTNRNNREIEAEPEIAPRSTTTTTGEPPVHLSLLPLNFSWPPATGNSNLQVSTRGGFDVNRPPSAEELEEGAALSSSPNSAVSSFQMDFSARHGAAATTSGGGSAGNGDAERKGGDGGSHSRASDEDETGSSRKKLRLSKEQSAFLEESFKEHNTLNPKQKLALAKQLNLRPRQVEVWFQNRRARTKLKQTEVDCEYLKRCCETLTEENRRLQKELAELRALKTAHPFYMHLPATTLSMCPSCERVASSSASSSSVVGTSAAAATATATATATTSASDHRPNSFAALFTRPRSGFPFSGQPQQPPASS